MRPAIFLVKRTGARLASLASHVLRKIVAAFVLILAASPFTAPFATCDMTTLVDGGGLSIESGWTGRPATDVDRSLSAAVCGAPERVREPLKPASQAATLSAVDVAAPEAIATHLHARAPHAAALVSPPLRSLRI
jgi:hypothetical protein